MTTATKPAKRPGNICFSSGPCAKRPGWSLKALENAFLGRSHRAKDGKARLKLAIDKTKALLGLPPGYLCAIVPASDTGAFEMAMWSILGARGVEALAWESFGKGWVTDVAIEINLGEIGQAAVLGFRGLELLELELLGDVGHPALAEAFPGQRLDAARAQHAPHGHLEGLSLIHI